MEIATAKPRKRKDARIAKMVDREMPKRFFDHRLHCPRDRRLATARSAIQQYDLT
jgi:hypothetical protein